MFDRIANFQALCTAALKAARGKRSKPGVAVFLANLEGNVLRLERGSRAGIPFAVLRAIVDPQTTVIPAAALAAIDELERPRIASLLSALAREPRDLLALVRLSAGFRAALASLKRAAGIAGLSIGGGE